MSNDIRLDGKVAIVTGAGGGLGRQHALLLAKRGASVIVNDLGGACDGSGNSSSAADTVVDEIKAAGGQAAANYDSVATPEGGAAIVQSAVDTFGSIDILVNNAGILRDKTFVKLENEQLHDVLDVHLRGAFYVTQPAFIRMKAAGYGRIVFTSSAAGLFGNFGQSNYGAAKMGVVGLSNVLALEGFKYNVRSNVVAPLARTRMTEDLLGPLTEALSPEHVSPLVAWLCSEQCEATHKIFSAGGGRFAEIFVGLTRGWLADGAPAAPCTPEAIRDNLGAITARDGAIEPTNVTDEFGLVMELLK